ncbi:MAG: hypothetical protein AVDCRST_MAG87-3467 [uncultured Thermomicrobiales bacterium]|uniref:Uncharacterized protein n=1 Tax=uncultured Thermomicrobiales bacterium TaxID=1645740 RepID=A0A6J4VLJ1_9BACT|nr:MAG: hypothetical protein AVDCRST_MAG87-3467 [uncultured Thermomicrobiales bacterium]
MRDPSPQSGDVPRQAHWHRRRSFWRCLVFAAEVALRQLGPAPVREDRQAPPYVLLLPGESAGFSTREVAGGAILTEALDLSVPHRAPSIDNPN